MGDLTKLDFFLPVPKEKNVFVCERENEI